ncbi:LamG domain-containing protein [Micromonospora sp. NPDC047644]|uniref:LamG domain-containing protein n=1 Tax=Micromonospora sp. NPDC047644 TaxID=3157203 RepID=UPI00345333D0
MSALLASLLHVVWQADRAAAEQPDSCAVRVSPTAESERAAQALAESCDTSVEVLAAATETTKVFAQPSGDFTLEAWAEPRWTKRNGSWRQIDTTLTVGADGLVRPVASTADVVFSTGGAGPFATMAGAGTTFSLGWPSPLPAGVIDRDTITYPNVLPDVDLVVRAEKSGFAHLLVVKTPAAAKNPAVRETRYVVGGSADVATGSGGVVISGPDGVLAAAPPALAWDSALPPVKSGARRSGLGSSSDARAPGARSSVRGPAETAAVTPVSVRVEDTAMTVAAAPELLASDHFPIFIDPAYDKKPSRWAPVNDSNAGTAWTSGTAWPREIVRVGSNWDNHGDIWRSHFQFDTTVLAGKRLTGTPSVDAYAVHSGDCDGESVGLWQTGNLSSYTNSWDGMAGRWMHGGALQTKLVKANGGCSGQSANWVAFNAAAIKEKIQDNADDGLSAMTFGLRMGTESGGRWAKFDPSNVKMVASYQHKPTSPVAIRTAPGGTCSKTSPGPWVNVATPTLYGKASDGDGSVKVVFDLNGPTSPAEHFSAWTTSGEERGWATPTLAEGDYNWRVRGTDETDPTGWTGLCYFRVDRTGPTTPIVTRTSGTPTVGQPVTLSFTSSDARSGMKQFAYGIGVDARQTFVASTGTTSITFTPEAGRTVVYVWAQDNAGNYSARAAFNFFTGRITEAQNQGAWRLDGDGLDDSGEGRDLVLGSGVGYGPDRKGSANAALTFSSAGCAQASPAVRTDAEYTVAGWVNLASKNGNKAIVAQTGSVASAFVLSYNADVDRWRISLTNADSSTVTYATADGAAAAIGVWQHVAATVDPVAKVVRLYVGGALAAENAIPFTPWNAKSRLLLGCAGGASTTFHHMTGSVDHVGVWQGLLSEAQIARAATELPAGQVGRWQLRGDGVDSTGFARDATVPADLNWADDPFGRVESAAQLNGNQCLGTPGPVVRTDESFTVATWVRLTDVSAGTQTALGQDNEQVSGFLLGTRQANDGARVWSMVMKDTSSVSSGSVTAKGSAAGSSGKWTHLAGTYDATSKRLSLYVNGTLAESVTRNAAGWQANGPLTIGCGRYDSKVVDRINGAVSDVRAWRGALTAAEVAAVHGGNPAVKLEGMWPLDGPASDTPTYLTDWSGNGRDLTITGPYAWTRDRGFGRDGALGLELAEGSCAETSGPTVRTDASFTVSAWVVLDQTTGHHSVVTQIATAAPGFFFGYNPGPNRWHFGMPSASGGTPTWHIAESQQAPELGKWTHLAGVYDLAKGKVRLYVDGVLQDEQDGPSSPWMASGPTLVGCNGNVSGTRFSRLGGVVDDVRLWTSTVDPDRIADLAAG